MTLDAGDQIPDTTFIQIGDDGPKEVAIRDYVAGRTVVIFAVPGAFTGTCTTAHLPSFVRVHDDLAAKGVDEVICISVNDPFVMRAWGESTGGAAAGITFLADAESAFAFAMGRSSNFPAHGMINRSKRYAMVVKDGTIASMHAESQPGVCDVSAGERVLEAV